MNTLKKTTWRDLIWLFGIPAILNLVATQIAIPYLDSLDIFPIEMSYFLSVGLLVLAPMFFWSLYLCATEVGSFQWRRLFERMRIKRLTRADVIWTCATFIMLVATSYLIAKVFMPKMGMDARPFFFRNMPLTDSNMWLIYVWPVFFFFNIFGEEFLWRGYIQPRQELLNGNWTWLVHGLFWAAWHLPMGLDLIIAATPIFFILPAVVQLRKNTTISIIVHTIFGAFGFLALSFGTLH